MSTPTSDEPSAISRQLSDRVAAIVTSTLIVITGSVVWLLVLWGELRLGPQPVEWPVFLLMSGLLVIGETSSRCWIRTGNSRPVTPLWLFAYALLLLGPPALALTMTIFGTLLGGLVRRETGQSVALRMANVAISMGIATLILAAWDTGGRISDLDGVSWRWVFEAGVAGVSILLLNTFVTAVHDSVGRSTPLTTMLHRGVGARITAEGALLSLAPIWVVGLDFSLALLPLLATTTLLVFRSTRQALERSYEAHHDALTGLANRRAFYDRVSERFGGLGATGNAAVLLMDLDRFKEINDQLGHEFGDRLLIAFADRLVARLPKNAVAARLGGDEFAVLLPIDHRSATPDDGGDHLEDLHAAMVEPLLIEGFPVSIGASIGVALAPRHGRTPSDLLRAADVAMYKAKRSRSSIERYDDCVQLPRRGRIALLSDLGEALTDHQFRVHFQPQLRMSTGNVDTVEALIRWQHPVHGMIPPGEFIDLAEQTDLIGPITEVVLRMSTFGLLASGASGASGVKLAVNVSTRSLQDRYFAPLVFTVLSEAGFPPNLLELEVTERALVTNPERSAYTIERLRESGVSIAIDDFGKGYSSFETLRQLQVDRVKIDAAFVSGLLSHARDRAIVEAVIDLAHRLGLEVIAEGVESTQVWEVLRAIGCDVAQGFGIAHPMSLPDLKGWLTTWNEVRVEQFVQQAVVTEPAAAARSATERRPTLG